MPYDNLDQLRQDCVSCARCPLCSTRHNVVFGVGPEHTDVMFIGEGPGENEDLQGEPFVGAAGQLLDEMLSIIGLSRRNCYIANIVKCRPPQNRDPKPEEREKCSPWLTEQIQLIHPKIIVCLGRIAAMEYINPNFRITREHGLWYDIEAPTGWPCSTPPPCSGIRGSARKPSVISRVFRPWCVCTVLISCWKNKVCQNIEGAHIRGHPLLLS